MCSHSLHLPGHGEPLASRGVFTGLDGVSAILGKLALWPPAKDPAPPADTSPRCFAPSLMDWLAAIVDTHASPETRVSICLAVC